MAGTLTAALRTKLKLNNENVVMIARGKRLMAVSSFKIANAISAYPKIGTHVPTRRLAKLRSLLFSLNILLGAFNLIPSPFGWV
jgi:hypothetical protein